MKFHPFWPPSGKIFAVTSEKSPLLALHWKKVIPTSMCVGNAELKSSP